MRENADCVGRCVTEGCPVAGFCEYGNGISGSAVGAVKFVTSLSRKSLFCRVELVSARGFRVLSSRI
jgi:hypothetical protein